MSWRIWCSPGGDRERWDFFRSDYPDLAALSAACSHHSPLKCFGGSEQEVVEVISLLRGDGYDVWAGYVVDTGGKMRRLHSEMTCPDHGAACKQKEAARCPHCGSCNIVHAADFVAGKLVSDTARCHGCGRKVDRLHEEK